MGRAAVREFKRAMRAALRPQASADESERARASALALLDRSIRFGHDRVALLRLAAAVRLGARVSAEQWQYCEAAMARIGDEALYDRLIETVRHQVIQRRETA